MEQSSSDLPARDDLAFEAWLRHVFDHSVSKPEWYWSIDQDPWEPHPRIVLGYLTQLFESPQLVAEAYSREQLGEGFWYLSSGICSGYMNFLHLKSIPWGIRRRTLSAIPVLFEKLFVSGCGDSLGHLDQRGDDKLCGSCYMWWDIFPTRSDAKDAEGERFANTLLDTMSSILMLPSEACKESALHGLGHEEDASPDRVHEIIDRFLCEQPDISPELHEYAQRARSGGIL